MNNHFLSHFPIFGGTNLNPRPFQVYKIKSQLKVLRTCNQRVFYKICLITGKNIIHYANKKVEIEGTNLFLANANTTCNWELISKEQKGYACILTKDFLQKFNYSNVLQQSSLFETDCITVCSLSDEQKNFITTIFHKMISEQRTNYIFKYELMHAWISLIIHEALKIKTTNDFLTKQILLS